MTFYCKYKVLRMSTRSGILLSLVLTFSLFQEILDGVVTQLRTVIQADHFFITRQPIIILLKNRNKLVYNSFSSFMNRFPTSDSLFIPNTDAFAIKKTITGHVF